MSFLDKLPKGHETVLLVDDESLIIDIQEAMLKTLGYKVLIAMSGNEAIEVYKKNRKDINAVILDYTLPDMLGGETFDRLRFLNPETKILLSSGFDLNDQIKAIMDRGCDGFLQKPFNLKELSYRLRDVLDGY